MLQFLKFQITREEKMIKYTFIYDNDFNIIPNKDRVNIVREFILKNLEKVSLEAYKAFNFREKGFPPVIYQKPYKNNLTVFVKEGDVAHLHINDLIKILHQNNITYKGTEFKAIKKVQKMDELVVIPKKTDSIQKYNLISPLLLFTSEDKFPIYVAINNKYPNLKERQEILKEKASQLIRDNLKWQLQNLLKYKKYDILDQIDIEWNSFDIKMVDFHKNERKTPAIFGSFSSSWVLPRFIGQKIGKGFGQINRARNFSNK
jgi:hypothetical protein